MILPTRPLKGLLTLIYGIILCLAVAAVSTGISSLQHLVGAPIIGLIFGILISNLAPSSFVSHTKKGAAFSAKYLLKVGIILAGGTLSLKVVAGAGLPALPMIIVNILVSFAVAALLCKLLGQSTDTAILVGGGTAICGGTAIATLSSILESEEKDTAYAMTAIFLVDIIAALAWPYIAIALGLTAEQYGILGGLAISDTSSVSAAGATFDALTIAGSAAAAAEVSGGSLAVVVKLTRTVMLVFVAIAVMGFKLFRDRKSEQTSIEGQSFARRALKTFPVFVLGFLAMAVLNTLIGFSSVSIGSLSLSSLLSKGYKFLIATALVGVGYKIKLRELFTHGAKPLLIGAVTWLAISATTLAYVMLVM